MYRCSATNYRQLHACCMDIIDLAFLPFPSVTKHVEEFGRRDSGNEF